MSTALTTDQIELVVHDAIRSVLAERSDEIPRFSGGDKLNATLGLTSLDLAFLVTELEIQLGIDPFAKLVPITSIRSVDDLVHAYRQALFPEARPAAPQDHLAAAVQRAQMRRERRESN
jgi:acyl carrier protein